jgi:hypothetical protein
MTLQRMRSACWIPKATDKHSEYVILIAFSTATMVTRTRPNVTIYGHYLSWYLTISDNLHYAQIRDVEETMQ